MTLQDLGAVGDFIGGIGVIVSLLYLARQIRDSSRIERLNARHAVSQAISSALSRIDDDPELHRIWVAARGRGEELTEEDRERLGRFLYRYFAQLSLAYGYSEIDPEIRARNETLLLRFLRVPAVQGWWSRQRAFLAEPSAQKLIGFLRPSTRSDPKLSPHSLDREEPLNKAYLQLGEHRSAA